MNKLEINSPVFTLSSSTYSEPETSRRLVVLVPEAEADTSGAARKIWELANALGSQVQFLGLCKDEVREPSLRRQIIAMSSMVGGGSISVESKIEFGGNWLDFVKSNLHKGDVVACFAEHRAGFTNRPLSQILESNLNATVYVLPEFQSENPRSNWVSSAAGGVGSIAIIALFFWGQVKLTQMPQHWAHTSLLYLSIFIEAGLVWLWSSLF
ncbi:hypothetical protein JZU51_00560 [bacterium]|nr:hypothetical protein [bacterium]